MTPDLIARRSFLASAAGFGALTLSGSPKPFRKPKGPPTPLTTALPAC